MESFDIINWQLIERPELFDTLEEEFMEYQATVKGDVPEHIFDEAFVKDTPSPRPIPYGHGLRLPLTEISSNM